jgi:hypothetical protein
MMHVPFENLAIIVEKQDPTKISKASFPMRYGTYSEIKTPEYEFRFSLNGEIKSVRGLTADWPDPAEQLKRTDGNDWVYYTAGDDSTDKGIASWLGEYYMPCRSCSSNPIWEVNYFSNPVIMNAFAAWPQLYADLYSAKNDRRPLKAKALIDKILKNDDTALHERSQKLQAIIGGKMSVLPPDTRHVDYETIPLNIADGCLYRSKFCCVKSTRKFQARSSTDTYINIGLESADRSTLALIGKPLSEAKVREAFWTMLDMNASSENIEVTANFVIGEVLSENHYQSID